MPFENARPVIAGAVATLVTTVLFYPAFVFGVPMLDFATAFGAWLGEQPMTPLSDGWWLGFAEHLFNGLALLPLVYCRLVAPRLSGGRLWRGAVWGTLLFALSGFFVTPVLGLGFFSARAIDPVLFRIVQWASLVVYGTLFTTLLGRPQAVTEADVYEEETWRHAA